MFGFMQAEDFGNAFDALCDAWVCLAFGFEIVSV